MSEIIPLSPLVIGGRTVDGRTITAKRYRAICLDLASDLDSTPSAAQWLLVQRAAALSVQAEQLEINIASGEPCDVEMFMKLTNTLNRVLGSLGLRRQRDGSKARVIDEFASAVLSGEGGDNE